MSLKDCSSQTETPTLFYKVNLELIVELFTVLKFDLNSFKRFRNDQFYENVCQLFWQGWVILWLQ